MKTYWNYEKLDLDEKTNDEWTAEFRFYREDIYELVEQMQLPDEIAFYNGLVWATVPYLKRYYYPPRYWFFILQEGFLTFPS